MHFRQGNLWVQLYPRMETFLLVPCLARTTDVPRPGASTLISAPWIKNSATKEGIINSYLLFAVGDKEGECRAHGNLGSGYYSKGSYREALQHHQHQLKLAMALRNRKVAATALR